VSLFQEPRQTRKDLSKTIRQVKEKLRLEDVIGETVELVRRGSGSCVP
jgi:DNA primase